MFPNLGYQIHSNHELPYSTQIEFRVYCLVLLFFKAEVHLLLIPSPSSFSIIICFINITPKTFSINHWGLWLYQNCVHDLSFMPLCTKWNQKFNTTNELMVNSNIQDRTCYLMKSLFFLLSDLYELAFHQGFSNPKRSSLFFRFPYFPHHYKVYPTYLFNRSQWSHKYFIQFRSYVKYRNYDFKRKPPFLTFKRCLSILLNK